jgi:hypothetical protein
MKNKLLLLFVATMAILFQGCIKDKCTSTYSYTYYRAVYKTKAEVRANIKSNAPRDIEKPGKIYVRAPYIFLNEIDKGIHVIDNSNPANPVKKAFIDIPGNMDIAVKGNTLFADLYTDMVSIDIANPLNVSVNKVVEGVFPHRLYYGFFNGDTNKVIIEWIRKDTIVTADCSTGGGGWWGEKDVFLSYTSNSSVATAGGSGAVSPIGMGGSMARFSIMQDRLYSVGTNDLNVFNIGNASQPFHVRKTNVGWGIETIYPFKDKLFIGSTNGMFIFTVSNPDNPVQTGQFAHVQSCDPVIADDTHAYVTLRSGTQCRGFTNQLDVLTLNNVTNPTLLKTYQLTNPHGLSKDGNTLFICDGKDGLKVYNASSPASMQLLKQIPGFETYDVIAFNNNAIVVASDGLYQFSYADLNNITQVSKLSILKK